jgi:hypothetical protein
MARYGLIAVSLVIFMMTLAFPALALDSHPIADDYIRADFTVEDGLPDNVINAIVQTENGLWVGTESGLASFNGRDFSTMDLSTAGAPPQGAVHSLLQSSVGDLGGHGCRCRTHPAICSGSVQSGAGWFCWAPEQFRWMRVSSAAGKSLFRRDGVQPGDEIRLDSGIGGEPVTGVENAFLRGMQSSKHFFILSLTGVEWEFSRRERPPVSGFLET